MDLDPDLGAVHHPVVLRPVAVHIVTAVAVAAIGPGQVGHHQPSIALVSWEPYSSSVRLP